MDRITAMQAFVAVVEENGFTKASGKLNQSPQVVSKYVAQLEAHLRTRLLNRTTRKVHLTEAGQAYFERCKHLLEEIDDMEGQLLNMQGEVSGTLKLSAPLSFGVRFLADALVQFQHQCPSVSVNLQLNDRRVDIIDEGFDVALRIGRLHNSSLVAKLIRRVHLVCCASPEYLQKFGEPHTPRELRGHRFLKYSLASSSLYFAADPGEQASFSADQYTLESNNGDVLVRAAVQSAGIVVQPDFLVREAIEAGKLQTILSDYEQEPMGLYAVYAHRSFLSAKVRCFVDFIANYFS